MSAPCTERLVDTAVAVLGAAHPLLAEQHRLVVELARHAFIETNPIPAKVAVSALGFCGPDCRLPLVPMTPVRREAMLACMRSHGLLGA